MRQLPASLPSPSLFLQPAGVNKWVESTSNEGVWEDEERPTGTTSPLEKQLFQQ